MSGRSGSDDYELDLMILGQRPATWLYVENNCPLEFPIVLAEIYDWWVSRRPRDWRTSRYRHQPRAGR